MYRQNIPPGYSEKFGGFIISVKIVERKEEGT